jgi:hypothetical protein
MAEDKKTIGDDLGPLDPRQTQPHPTGLRWRYPMGAVATTLRTLFFRALGRIRASGGPGIGMGSRP